jgi:hypothetical protein
MPTNGEPAVAGLVLAFLAVGLLGIGRYILGRLTTAVMIPCLALLLVGAWLVWAGYSPEWGR